MKQQLGEYIKKNKKELVWLSVPAVLIIGGTIFITGVVEGDSYIPEEIVIATDRGDSSVQKISDLIDDSSESLESMLSNSVLGNDPRVQVLLEEQRSRLGEIEAHLFDLSEELDVVGRNIDLATPNRVATLLNAAVGKRIALSRALIAYIEAVNALLHSVEEDSADINEYERLMDVVNSQVREAGRLDQEYQALMSEVGAFADL